MKKWFFYVLIVFLASCASRDKLHCENGGVCVEDECLCPDEWMGEHCEQFRPPTAFRIKRIDLHHFASSNEDGMAWDDGTGDQADVFMSIRTKKFEFVYWETELVEDADWDEPHSFDGHDLSIHPAEILTIQLYDKDGIYDWEQIDEFLVIPYAPYRDLPEVIEVQSYSRHAQISLHIDWLWD